MADVKKLMFSIIRFLQDQVINGGLEKDAEESLEVGLQCLISAYELDPADPATIAKYQVQRNLLDIFNAQMSLEPDSDFSSLSLHEATEEEKALAEEKKNQGNEFMKAEKYSDAVECYTQALKLDNKNAVYFCNRAAAYSKLNKHNLTIEDCSKALQIDPEYSKAYGRMGIAYGALEDHVRALECYRKAVELDPTNQSYRNNMDIAEQKQRELEMAAQAGFNMGPAGGLGGLNFNELLNNPALVNVASTFMQNPEMQRMMANLVTGNTGGAQPGGGLSSLLQAGQQLAAQVEANHPDLVQQLRQHSQEIRQQQQQPPSDSSEGNDQNPPNPPPAQ